MRFQRTLALLGVGLLWWALGPWVLLVALLALGVPAVRAWLRPTWRTVLGVAAVVGVLVALVLVVPDGWLPMPPGAGRLVTPAYAGRPAAARPVPASRPPAPHLATPTDTAGPLGESPRVSTSWLGLERCGSLAVASGGRLVGLCESRGAERLRVLDPDSLRVGATKELPGSCPATLALDDHDRALVGLGRRLLVVATADADGEPDLTTVATVDLGRVVASGDCVVGLRPAADGRVWWASRAGQVGLAHPGTGRVRARDLGEEIDAAPAVDRGGAYVATTGGVYRLTAGAAGPPRVAWTSVADGSSAGPVLLTGGLVASADATNGGARLEVRSARSGQVLCRAGVPGAGEIGAPLVPVGRGVLVVDADTGPLGTLLGRSAGGRVTRIDVVDGACERRWSAEVGAAGAIPALSPATGLVYAVTKPRSWWGADAWYLTALDARTGHPSFRVRTGLGFWRDAHGSQVVLADGSAYVGTAGGLLRVRDRD